MADNSISVLAAEWSNILQSGKKNKWKPTILNLSLLARVVQNKDLSKETKRIYY